MPRENGKLNFELNKEPPQPSRDEVFVDSVYMCDTHKKRLIMLVVTAEKIVGVSPWQKSPKTYFEIKADRVTAVINSRNIANLYMIEYINEKGQEDFIVIEVFSLVRFISHLTLKGLLNKFSTENLEIEKMANFKNALLPIFKNQRHSGVVEMWINTFMTDWALVYLISIDDYLIKMHLEKSYAYADYKIGMKNVQIFRLDSWNLFSEKEKIGLRKPNSFALKIHNENIDLIFNCFSHDEKLSWVNNF